MTTKRIRVGLLRFTRPHQKPLDLNRKKNDKKNQALNAAAAWCLLKLRCPLEAADLEGCCGVSKSSGRSRIQGPPTSVPKECQGAAARLEACLERASEEESEERRG